MKKNMESETKTSGFLTKRAPKMTGKLGLRMFLAAYTFMRTRVSTFQRVSGMLIMQSVY